MIDVQFFAQGGPKLPLTFDQLRQAAQRTADELRLTSGDLSVVFLDDESLAEMHGTYLDDPSPTDVITFDLSDDDVFEAEIYISVARAREHAAQFNVSWESEVIRLVIHGMLHLAGFDDRNKSAYERMKKEEDRLVAMNSEIL